MNIRWTLAVVLTLAAGCRQGPGSGTRQVVEVMVVGKTVRVDAGPGHFWDEAVYNDSRTIAYLLKNRGSPFRGYSPHSIVKVTPDVVVDPVVANAEILAGDIMEIHKVSEDGARLLVDLHYVTKKERRTTYFKTRPVIYDVEKGEIREIEF